MSSGHRYAHRHCISVNLSCYHHAGPKGERRYKFSFLMSAVDGVLYLAVLCPWKRTLNTYWVGGWVGLRAGLDTVARGKILCLCRGSNPSHAVCSWMLYWLSYSSSIHFGTILYLNMANPSVMQTVICVKFLLGMNVFVITYHPAHCYVFIYFSSVSYFAFELCLTQVTKSWVAFLVLSELFKFRKDVCLTVKQSFCFLWHVCNLKSQKCAYLHHHVCLCVHLPTSNNWRTAEWTYTNFDTVEFC
jgi:hypothetical protein